MFWKIHEGHSGSCTWLPRPVQVAEDLRSLQPCDLRIWREEEEQGRSEEVRLPRQGRFRLLAEEKPQGKVPPPLWAGLQLRHPHQHWRLKRTVQISLQRDSFPFRCIPPLVRRSCTSCSGGDERSGVDPRGQWPCRWHLHSCMHAGAPQAEQGGRSGSAWYRPGQLLGGKPLDWWPSTYAAQCAACMEMHKIPSHSFFECLK